MPGGNRAFGCVALFLAVSGTLFGTGTGIGSYDFLSAHGDGLTLQAAPPLVKVSLAGREGVAPAVAMPADAVATERMPEPGYPEGRAGQRNTPASAEFVFTSSAAWPSGPVTLAIIAEYYDRASPAGLKEGGDSLTFSCPGSGRGGVVSGRILLAGRNKAAEPYRENRWRRHGIRLAGVTPPAATGPVPFLTLRASGTCVLRRLDIRVLPPESAFSLDQFTRDQEDEFFRQTRLVIDRARAVDVLRQFSRADAYARATPLPPPAWFSGSFKARPAGEPAHVAGWPERLTSLDTRQLRLLDLMRQAETLADRCYYEGRLAILEQQPDTVTALRRETDSLRAQQEQELAALQADLADLSRLVRRQAPRLASGFTSEAVARVPEHPDLGTIPPWFRERVRFLAFANSPWTGNGERWYELLRLYGVEAVFFITGYAADVDPATVAGGGDPDAPWRRSLDWNRRQCFDLHAQHGLRTVVATLHLHNNFIVGGLPGWFRDKYKGEEFLDRGYDGTQNSVGQNSGTVNLWHPGVRRYVADYAAAIGRQVARDEDLIGFSTFNEPRFSINLTHSPGYTKLAAAAFRDDLRARFGTIERLNAVWKSTYADFAGINPPRPAEVEPWQLTPLFHAWITFCTRSFEAYGNDIVTAFRKSCPDKLVWTEGMMSHLGDVGHTHVRPVPDVNISNYNLRRLRHKTIADAETGGGHAWEGERENTAEVDRAAQERNLFDALLWGQRGFTFWGRYFSSNANGYYAWFHDDPGGAMVLAARDCSSLAVLRDKADRFGCLLANTEVVGSGVGIVTPGVSVAGAPLPVDGCRALTGNLYTHGYPPFITSADDLADGADRLDAYRILILLRGPVVPAGFNAKLMEWVRNGGLMIAEGPWGWVNPDGEPEGGLLREAFGDLEVAFPPTPEQQQAIAGGRMQRKIAEPYRALCPWDSIGEWYIPVRLPAPRPGVLTLMADVQGNPLLLEAALGKGRVIISTVPIYALGAFIRDEICKTLPSLARCEKAGELHAVTRQDAKGNRYLGVVNANSRETLTSQLVISGAYRQVVDLGVGDGFPVPVTPADGATRVPVHLAPGEGTILRLVR